MTQNVPPFLETHRGVKQEPKDKLMDQYLAGLKIFQLIEQARPC